MLKRPLDLAAQRYPGKLIVFEGGDGVGRSTQIAKLAQWLRDSGYGVVETTMAESKVAGRGIREAVATGNRPGARAITLLYAADLSDRVRTVIIPALAAGFTVLSDRYTYFLAAQAAALGLDGKWATRVLDFAPWPHSVFYLKASVGTLAARTIHSKRRLARQPGFESAAKDSFDAFCAYQKRLCTATDRIARRHGFVTLDASRQAEEVFVDIRNCIS